MGPVSFRSASCPTRWPVFRHRSPINFLVNLVCGLIAYCHSPKKPALDLASNPDLLALPGA
jgi:hypothetical protein